MTGIKNVYVRVGSLLDSVIYHPALDVHMNLEQEAANLDKN